MPNSRNPEKRKIGVWMTPSEIADLKKLSAEKGMNLSEYLTDLARSYGKRKLKKKDGNSEN